MKLPFRNRTAVLIQIAGITVGLTACNEIPGLGPNNDDPAQDRQLSRLIDNHNLDTSPIAGRNLPDINDPIAQLGKKLFFSKSLGGDMNVACASCHHPALGGDDDLSLPVGVNATSENVLGLSRTTIANTGLWQRGLFWDSRVEQLAPGQISTPDSGFNQVDSLAGGTLAAAQARFPVTSETEMLGDTFALTSDNNGIREHLAERIGNYGSGLNALQTNEWLSAFQQAFGSSDDAHDLVTFENIAFAIGEYERSMVFIDSPWQRYIDGDVNALNDAEKRGAILFLTNNDNQGADCVRCHRGPSFSDERFNQVAFPQIGPNTNQTNGDTGREGVTQSNRDRYLFRTPSLLNIELTAPYGHAGAYSTLEQVLEHYDNPRRAVENFFDNNRICDLPQFSTISNCNTLFPNAENISAQAINQINDGRNGGVNGLRLSNINLSGQEISDIVSFLKSLTDTCAADISCLQPWIADSVLDNPDGQMLDAVF